MSFGLLLTLSLVSCRASATAPLSLNPSAWVVHEFAEADAAPWMDFIGEFASGRRLVGLGECSHYSSECYQLKASAVEQLMMDGFDGLILEVDLGQAILWNRYVVYGEGDLDDLVGRSGWFTYRTQEFKDLLAGLREHNQTSTKPFQVFGMEMTTLQPGLAWLADTIDAAAGDVEGAAAWTTDLRRKRPSVAFMAHSPEERLDYWELFAASEAFLSAQGPELEARLNEGAHQTVKQMVQVIRQYATYVSQDDSSLQTEIRDQFSARNVVWCLNQMGPDSRAVLWAHNGHVAKRSPSQSLDILGHYLDRWFGDAYGAVGFTFDIGELGTFGDDGFRSVQFERAPVPSLTASLASLGEAFLVLDVDATLELDVAQESALRQWTPMRRDVGEYLPEDAPHMWTMRVEGCYDALVYFDESHMPSALDWIR